MANLPAVLKAGSSTISKSGKNFNILSSNEAANPIRSDGDFLYSMFSGISKMLSKQTYTPKNLNKKMLRKTNIAKDLSEGRVTKNGRGKNGVYEGISHMDRLKLAHMNADGTYNKKAIAGSLLTATAGISGATHIAFGDDGVQGIPLI